MRGINTMMVVNAHEIIGAAYSLIASIIAVRGLYHARIFASDACTRTMIVSTVVPNERIRAKFVKKFIVYPPEYRRIKVHRNAIGRVNVANSEARSHTKRNIAMNTSMIVESASLQRFE
jgi:hypothetical protein